MIFHGTTIVGVIKDGKVALGGDGQVTFEDTIVKHNAKKLRRLAGDAILAGFAGSSADAFTLFERFEAKIEEFKGNLSRAAVELAKDWRTDRYLRRLEALLAVLDSKQALIISANGDATEPDDKIVSIGSGGPYALSAARALAAHSRLSAKEIVRRSLEIAAEICIYTNDKITVE